MLFRVRDFNTTGPRNSKLSKNLFNNKSNLFILYLFLKIYGQYLFTTIFTSTINLGVLIKTNYMNENFCPIHGVTQLLGGKWKMP